jgi:hypothetical protein
MMKKVKHIDSKLHSLDKEERSLEIKKAEKEEGAKSEEGKKEGSLEGKEGSLKSSPRGGEPSLEDLFPSEETFEDSLEGLREEGGLASEIQVHI